MNTRYVRVVSCTGGTRVRGQHTKTRLTHPSLSIFFWFWCVKTKNQRTHKYAGAVLALACLSSRARCAPVLWGHVLVRTYKPVVTIIVIIMHRDADRTPRNVFVTSTSARSTWPVSSTHTTPHHTTPTGPPKEHAAERQTCTSRAYVWWNRDHSVAWNMEQAT